ncbi:tRNA lysidine(34) synthetase TilS [Lichenicoccus sp.]|uniref:tRNA lysidine(34) synthetase TilS n=1 Tax=Lichenicoccus sp. TaxID=2781899 RepID=UPI003D105506
MQPAVFQELGAAEFERLMRPLGPWEGLGRLAVAVSGGADSLCLALLAQRWTTARGAGCLGLIVDHGLRDGSADEAQATVHRLRRIGVASRVLRLHGLQRGPALAARARAARYDALTRACRQQGIVDLLVAHHAGDQAETALMRQRAGSGPDGLAAMAQLVETSALRLLRPLLGVAPERLRATLRDAGCDWIEDPSNQDAAALRTRLRRELDGAEPGRRPTLLREVAAAGAARMARQQDQARQLARLAELRPQGFALLPPCLLGPQTLGPLIRTVAGAAHAPPMRAIAALVRRPRAATLGGARLLPAGRLGPGWLLVREANAMQPPVAAADGVLWDGRFRLHAPGVTLPPGARVGAARGRRTAEPSEARLPAVVLAAMPCLYDDAGAAIALPGGAGFAFEPDAAASQAAAFGGP